MSNIHRMSLICAAIVAFALFACNSDKPTQNIVSGELQYEPEAQVMALYYSGELRPPEDLTRQISYELTLLRETWGDSIPDVKITFRAPWSPSHLHMKVDDTAFDDLLAGRNRAWDSLCEYLGVNYYHYIPGLGTWVGIASKDVPLNPLRLGPHFVDFPGINYVHTQELPKPSVYLVRIDDNGTIRYFIQDFCSPDIYLTYHYFVIQNHQAVFMDRHCECHPDFDSIIRNTPPDSSYWILQAYADSVEQARPAWVDTARQLVGDIEHGEQFSWSRPSK